MVSLLDQAAGLRAPDTVYSDRAARPLVAVASGKGGVGKTFLAVNMALALAERGARPLLVDMDWGLANVDVVLGLAPKRHLGHVLQGDCSLQEAVVEAQGLAILPNGCGEAQWSYSEMARHRELIQAVQRAPMDASVAVVDTHPGIGEANLAVIEASAAVVVVTTPEPTSITDTYALFKVMVERGCSTACGLVVNQAASARQASEVAAHLDAVANRFLGQTIPYFGAVLHDAAVPRAVQFQQPLMALAPRCLAARGVRELAASMGERALLRVATGGRQ